MLWVRKRTISMLLTCMIGTNFSCAGSFDWSLLPSGKFCMLFLSSADFIQSQLFQRILFGIPSESQIVWIQFRPDILLRMSGLIWVQTVCKIYQQTTLVGIIKLQSTLVNSTMHNSILSLISTRWPGPGIFPYILLQFHNVYLDNG